jgi:hypothetical protein
VACTISILVIVYMVLESMIIIIVGMFLLLVSMLMIHPCGGQSTSLVTVFMIVVVG